MTAQRVVVFDEDLCSLATDLLDTLRAASAIGITDGVRTYVNPQIVWASADMIRHEEGSVSMVQTILRFPDHHLRATPLISAF